MNHPAGVWRVLKEMNEAVKNLSVYETPMNNYVYLDKGDEIGISLDRAMGAGIFVGFWLCPYTSR